MLKRLSLLPPVTVVLAFALFTTVSLHAQTIAYPTQGSHGGKTKVSAPVTSPFDEFDLLEASFQPDVAEQARVAQQQQLMRNEEQHRRLVADTERLMQLVAALHADVSNTTKDTLSLNVVRRAEEIEKLARSVKERMKAL